MGTTSKIGGGRFSVLISNDSQSPKLDTSSPARMLNVSELKSLREFAISRIKAGSVVLSTRKSGRVAVTVEPESAGPERARVER